MTSEKDFLIEELTNKLDQMNKKMEKMIKDPIIKAVGPRLDITLKELQTKGIMELKLMKDVLDREIQPSFKSGTKMSGGKSNQRTLLDSTFDRAQARRLANTNKDV